MMTMSKKRFIVQVKKRSGEGWRQVQPRWAKRTGFTFRYKLAKAIEAWHRKRGRKARVRVDVRRSKRVADRAFVALWLSGDILEPKLDMELQLRLARLAKYLGRRIHVNSGYRSNAEQQRLYDLYKAGQGPLAAKPGTSNHNRGTAIDAVVNGQNLGAVVTTKTLRRFGLHLPVSGEAWHVEKL